MTDAELLAYVQQPMTRPISSVATLAPGGLMVYLMDLDRRLTIGLYEAERLERDGPGDPLAEAVVEVWTRHDTLYLLLPAEEREEFSATYEEREATTLQEWIRREGWRKAA